MRKTQLIVTYMDDSIRYYPVGLARGWKYDNMNGVELLVIGNGLNRTMIPVCNTRSIELNQYEATRDE